MQEGKDVTLRSRSSHSERARYLARLALRAATRRSVTSRAASSPALRARLTASNTHTIRLLHACAALPVAARTRAVGQDERGTGMRLNTAGSLRLSRWRTCSSTAAVTRHHTSCAHNISCTVAACFFHAEPHLRTSCISLHLSPRLQASATCLPLLPSPLLPSPPCTVGRFGPAVRGVGVRAT